MTKQKRHKLRPQTLPLCFLTDPPDIHPRPIFSFIEYYRIERNNLSLLFHRVIAKVNQNYVSKAPGTELALSE